MMQHEQHSQIVVDAFAVRHPSTVGVRGNVLIQSVTVVRMEVPCCGGIEHAVKNALQNSGKMIPWQVVVLATNGDVLSR